jgi:hypothetical protein
MAERFRSAAERQLSDARDRRERLASAEAALVETALTAPSDDAVAAVDRDPAEPVHDPDRRN